MSKFPLNLLLQISKALVNSKIQFFTSEIRFLDFGPASSHIFQPSRGPPPPSLTGLLRLSDSTVTSLSLLVPIQPSPPSRCLADSAVASLSLIGGPTPSVSPGSSPSSDNARARPCHHCSPATERRPAPRLGCHRTVTSSPSFPLP
jgi:hypothetical protein